MDGILEGIRLTPQALALIEEQGELSEDLQRKIAAQAGPKQARTVDVDRVAYLLLLGMPREKLPALQQRLTEICSEGRPKDQTISGLPINLANIRAAQLREEFSVPVALARHGGQPVNPAIREAVAGEDATTGRLFMPADAQVVAICNASNPDPSGRMPIIHVIVRERAKAAWTHTDFVASRLFFPPPHQDATPTLYVSNEAGEVDWYARSLGRVKANDKLVTVAFGADWKELEESRDGRNAEASVYVLEFPPVDNDDPEAPLRPALDARPYNKGHPIEIKGLAADRPVHLHENVPLPIGRAAIRFADKIRLPLLPMPDVDSRVTWTQTTMPAFQVGLDVGAGVVFEPGAQLTVNVLGMNVSVTTPPEDWTLPGNPRELRGLVTNGYAAQSYVQVMTGQKLTITSKANDYDLESVTPTLSEHVFVGVNGLRFAGQPVQPLGDVTLGADEAAEKGISIVWAHENRCLVPKVVLEKGLLAGEEEGLPIKGWQIDVGYVGPEGAWRGAETIVLDDAVKSGRKTLTLPPISSAGEMNHLLPASFIEVQVRTHENHMVQRIRIPMSQVKHERKVAPQAQS